MTIDNELRFEISQANQNLQLLTKTLLNYSNGIQNTQRVIKGFNKEQSALGRNLNTGKKLKTLSANAKELDNSLKSLPATVRAARTALTSLSKIRSTFGFQGTGGASIGNIQQFDAANEAFQRLATQTGAKQSQITSILNNLSGSYRGTSRKIRDAIVEILKAQAQLGGRSGAAAQKQLEQLGPAIKSVRERAGELLLSWQSVTRIFISQAIFRALTSINQELRESVSLARDVELAIAEVRTLAPGLDADLARRFTTGISNDFGIDQVEVARAAYEAFSNQVGSTAEVFTFLDTSANFAKATLTDLADTQDLLSGVLNSYGLAASNAEKISDQLFKTIDLGRVRGEEIANTYGRILPLAAQLGVSFEEVNASLAATTIQGVKADTALTQIQNIMKGLIKPTDALRQRFQELGVAGAEAGIAQFGLVGFLQQITAETNTVEDISEFFNDIRELRGVLGVLANDGDDFARSLREIRDEAQGASRAAEQIIFDTQTEELERSVQTIKNAFAEEIGRPFVETINNIIERLGGAEKAADAVKAALIGIGAAGSLLVLGQLGSSIFSVTTAALGLQTSLGLVGSSLAGLGIFGLAAGGIAGLVYLFTQLDSEVKDAALSTDDLNERLSELNKTRREAARTQLLEQQDVGNRERQAFDQFTASILDQARERRLALADVAKDAEKQEKRITTTLKTQIDDRLRAFESFVDKVRDSVADARDAVRDLLAENRDIDFDVNQGQFERNLRGAGDDREAARLLGQRAAELRTAAREAFSDNDAEFAQTLLREADRVASRLADIDGQRSRGESLIKQIAEERKEINNELIDQEIEKAKVAQQQLTALQQQSIALQTLAEDFKDLLKEISGSEISAFDRDELTQRIKDIGEVFEAEFQSLNAKDLLGFDDEIKDLQQSFRDLEGNKVSLSFLIEEGLRDVEKKLAELRFPVQVEARLDSVGVQGGISGPDNAVQKLIDLSKEFKRLDQDLDNYENAVDGAAESQSNLALVTNNLNKLLEQNRKRLTERGPDQVIDTGLGSAVIPGDIPAAEQVRAFNEVETTLARINDLVREGELQKAVKAIGEISQEGGAGSDSNIPQINSQLKTLSSTITSFAEAQSSLSQLQIDEKAQERVLAQYAEIVSALEESGFEINFDISDDKLAEELKNIIDASQLFLNQNQLTIPVQPQTQQGPVQGRQRGGVIYRNNGGFVPRGTDTVPAMLSPGEFVVNAAASRRFYSQLQAINSGQQPIYRQQGGPVTNTNIGDINVNVTAQENQIDGRGIAKNIRRELRRNAARL